MKATGDPVSAPDGGDQARPARPVLRRIAVALGVVAALLLLVALVGALWLHSRLTGSLARLDGETTLGGLELPVIVERDGFGVPTIRAETRTDASRALGFVHAQERFFQMDLLRRRAAGELAALFGSAALQVDRTNRVHRFRFRAERGLATAGERERALLQAYADGVNAGLADLETTPPEYLLLRVEPLAWRAEDAFLVLYSMYFELQDYGPRHETTIGLLRESLPRELFEFLTPLGSRWDAPIVGGALTPAPVPGREILDLRGTASPVTRPSYARAEIAERRHALGSNNWAVAGARTADGGALLANDMHLGLAVPNIWYRAAVEWVEAGVRHSVCGVTLPGVPALVGGSNGRVAWGFTNTHGDFTDLVVVETIGDGESYRSPEGPMTFERIEERIAVKGEPEVLLEVVSTIWGPIVDSDSGGRPLALRWVAHDPVAADLELIDLELAQDLDEALAIAQRSGIPTQNFVAVDATGRIGWTPMGPLPSRFGMTGRHPESWADGARGWSGWVAPEDFPSVVDPPSGQIWSANNRVGDVGMQRIVGWGDYALGARAGQIRDALLALDSIEPEDLLRVQLDDRALFLTPWRELLLELLTHEAVESDERRRQLLDAVRDGWTGRASVDSVGYRMVRAFRIETAQRAFAALTASCEQLDERCDYLTAARWDGPLWQLVTERPSHLLDPAYASWEELLLDAADGVLDYFLSDGEGNLGDATWGARNVVRIQHPISGALPALSRWLDMPTLSLPGDWRMPRVQSPRFGASQRTVVSPGREADGIFHMPTGQSGHPLSPYYRKGHQAWVEGRATPFLPGAALHRLTLSPG